MHLRYLTGYYREKPLFVFSMKANMEQLLCVAGKTGTQTRGPAEVLQKLRVVVLYVIAWAHRVQFACA